MSIMTDERRREIDILLFEQVDMEVEEQTGLKKEEMTSEQIYEFVKDTFYEPFCSENPSLENSEIKAMRSEKSFLKYWKLDNLLASVSLSFSEKLKIPEEEFLIYLYLNIKEALLEIGAI